MRIVSTTSSPTWCSLAAKAGRAALAALVLGLPALCAAPAASAQQPEIEGHAVAEVHVVDENGSALPAQLPLLTLEPGKPFDFAEERASLRILYRTGDYSDIRVETSPVSDGLRVDFVVRRNFFNNVIRVEGVKDPPTIPAALAALRLNLGEPFRESSVREAVDRLTDALHAEGLYLAKVSYSLEPHEDTRQMDILVTVVPGPRALLGAISVKNQTPYSDADLLKRTKLSPKNDSTSARMLRDSQRLKKYLVNQGYLGAGVLITTGTYDAASNRVPLTVDVTTGPRVDVEVSGARIGKSRLRKLLPIYAEGAVDDDLLQEGRRNIRDYFQREGYFDADVQVSSHQDAKSDQRVIEYAITRGDKFRLVGVSFAGNKYFGSQLLSGRLGLVTASFASSGRFSQQLVRSDADSVRALYQSNGFGDVQVTSTVDDNHDGKKGNLFVSFQIVEGPQTRVASLALEGNQVINSDSLLAIVGSSAGQPYSEANVSSDRNNILALYYNEGFPEAHFQEVVKSDAANNTVQLVYRITEGPQIRVAQVLLTGYQFTRPGIIRRQVQIEPHGPLREGDVVETQRRLYNLGVFTRVQIAPQNPDGTDPLKTVVVDTTEGGRYTIGYGVGFEVQRIGASCSANSTTCDPNATEIAASPRGIFEIARSNMFGRAQTLSFKVRASTLQYRSVLSYTADNFLNNRRLSLQLTAFADKSQDIDTFTSTRYEGSTQVVQKLGPGSSMVYRYFYRRVKASDLRVDPDEIPLLSQPTQVSGFGITYARDRRDNPGDATRGTFNTIDLSDAIQSIGSSSSFFRAYFQNSSFHPFGRAFVFARSTRFGFEQVLADTVEPGDASCAPDSSGEVVCKTIPLPERFFAGGGTSLRGFALNQAGPRDPATGFPIGGLALLMFNQEIRFPMKLPLVGNRLGGQIFYDAGNVYSDASHISFRWRPPSPTNLTYLSHTVGFGFRYPTPVGPVRVDFSYQLNSPQYLVSPPTGPATLYQLPHFQFSFNIGPVF
ncbi:MAG: POTRA domain-containing protein [Candidatus Acidiferrales bacterium]